MIAASEGKVDFHMVVVEMGSIQRADAAVLEPVVDEAALHGLNP